MIEVTGPDGSIHEFPDDTSEGAIKIAMAQHYGKGQESQASDIAKSVAGGLGRGVTGLLGLPGDLLRLGSRVGVFPDSEPPLIPSSKQVQDTAEGVTGKFYEPQTTAGKFASSAAEFVPGALAGPGGVGRNALMGITAGLGSEGAGELAHGGKIAGYDAEPIARAVGGIAGALAPAAARKAITPLPMSEARAPLVETLKSEGVPLTAGQTTGSKPLQWMESILGDIPGSGGKAHAIQDAQKEAFTNAAMKKAGGEGLATPENMSANYDRLGKQFEDLSARNTMKMDPQFAQDVGEAVKGYVANSIPGQRPKFVGDLIDNIQQWAPHGGIPGESYQSLRSDLGKKAQSLAQNNPPLADYYRSMRDALDKAMQRSISPEDAAAWSQTRREYGNYKLLERSAAGAGEKTAEGYISPAQLRTAAATGNKRGMYARGEGDMADLARAGVGVMSPLPQSGTAPRHSAQAWLAAPGAALGALAGNTAGHGAGGAALGALLAPMAPAVAGRALMSAPVQGYLGNQVAAKGLLAELMKSPDKRNIGLLMLADPQTRALLTGAQ